MPENKLKILAIDDKPDNLTVVAAVAADAFPGAGILTATDGARGLALALAEDPDVILLDVVMPGMDGFEVCRRLKADARTADTPVLFLTAARIKNEISVKALAAGGEGFLSKPFEQADLVMQVRAMAKIKEGNVFRRLEKERLAALLEERTHELIEESDGHLRTGEALANVDSRYKSIFISMTEGFALCEVLCDKQGKPVDYRFLEVNPAFERITGIKQKNIAGRTMLELSPDTDKRWIEALGHVALTRGTLHLEETRSDLAPGKVISATVFSPMAGQFAMIFTDVTARKRAEDGVKASLAEKEVLLREIHHRVKNNLQVVSSLLNLQSRAIKDETALAAFSDSRARVRAMALVHETLYRSQDLGSLNMRDYAGKLLEALKDSCKAGEQVRFTIDICDCRLNVDTAVSLGLILSELVSNSFKHAFPGGRRGSVAVAITREAGGYCLSVQDDGPGLPPDYDLRAAKSLGMQLVGTLARQISGTVEAVPGKSARFAVHFPAEAAV
jgi:PAS domain S-box-containing protein